MSIELQTRLLSKGWIFVGRMFGADVYMQSSPMTRYGNEIPLVCQGVGIIMNQTWNHYVYLQGSPANLKEKIVHLILDIQMHNEWKNRIAQYGKELE